jgi:uncharacterized protein YecT (DUF1311 family)
MRNRYSIVFAVLIASILCAMRAAPVAAQADKPTVEDRAAIAACLDLVEKNKAAEAAKPDSPADEKPSAEAQLKTAAAAASVTPESCIGAINDVCQSTPEGMSTMGMVQCEDRELAVWDERLNKSYRDSLNGADPKYRDALRKAQRAWIAYRDARCAFPALENEGGSIVGPLTEYCMMEETARQALWLSER